MIFLIICLYFHYKLTKVSPTKLLTNYQKTKNLNAIQISFHFYPQKTKSLEASLLHKRIFFKYLLKGKLVSKSRPREAKLAFPYGLLLTYNVPVGREFPDDFPTLKPWRNQRKERGTENTEPRPGKQGAKIQTLGECGYTHSFNACLVSHPQNLKGVGCLIIVVT